MSDLNCEVCNGILEHINDYGLICKNCDLGNELEKVYVVVEEFCGTIADVHVYRKEPKNLKPMDENGDEGERCFELEIQESRQCN